MRYGIKKWLYIGLSFLVVALAQPDISQGACILASAVGYALFWKGMLCFDSKKSRFWLALVWFAPASGVHLGWLGADRYVGFYIYIFLSIVLFCLGAQFALISLLVSRKMSLLRALALASFGALFEWSRLFILSGYSFDPIGLALTATASSMQLAAIWGIFGLTFWILLTNVYGLWALRAPMQKKAICIWGGLALLPYLFGFWHIAHHEKKMIGDENPPLSVVLVQTSLTPEQKAAFSGSTQQALSPLDQWRRIFTLLKPHQNTPVDLIVLSESALPYGSDLPLYYTDSIDHSFQEVFGTLPSVEYTANETVGNAQVAKALASLFDADVVIGLEKGESIEQSQEFRAYNSGYLFYPDEKSHQRYDKRVLVPMGEYIPFAWCKKFLKRYGICDSFTPGDEAKVFAGSSIPLSLSICYEETFGHLMRECRKKGASLLINLTNDGWYPNSRLAVVHFLHGRPRSVENGMPMLRSCNTGVTCGIDSLGRVRALLPFETKKAKSEANALHFYLPTYSYQTVYTVFGDHLIVAASSFFSLAFLFSIYRKKR